MVQITWHYLRDGIVVDVDDLVEVSHNNLGDIGQLLEVVSMLRCDVHVECNGCKVANCYLPEEKEGCT